MGLRLIIRATRNGHVTFIHKSRDRKRKVVRKSQGKCSEGKEKKRMRERNKRDIIMGERNKGMK